LRSQAWGLLMSFSRIFLLAPLLTTATIAFAADVDGDGCEDLQYNINGACIDDTALLDGTVTTTSQTVVADGVSIGPFVALGDVFIARNAIVDGWVAHSSQPLTIGDGSVIGRQAHIGADNIFGQDTSIARAATFGPRVTIGSGASVGYAAEVGADVIVDDGAVTGNFVELGDFTHLGLNSVVGRRTTVTGVSSVADRSDVLGIVGNRVDIRTGVLIEAGSRVRKDAWIQDDAQIMDGADVGRDAIVETGATVHGRVRAYALVCAYDTVPEDQVVPRYENNQGTVTCNEPGDGAPPALEQRPRPLAVGGIHACAVLPDETAVCWGDNSHGQLGNGVTVSSAYMDNGVYVPAVEGADEGSPIAVPGLTDVAGFALGSSNTCALKTDGTVWCWGYNGWGGQLGIGAGIEPPLVSFSTPQQVVGLTDATAIASSYHHYCAVKSDTTVVCWGYGVYGGLGDGVTTSSDVPIQVLAADGNPLSGMLDIAVGSYGSCALATDGQVFCWGAGATLGANGADDGYGGNANSFTPLKVVGLENISEISMGQARAFALEPDGTVLGWGSNSFHEMGNSATGPERTPITAFVGAGPVEALGGYEQHSCMLLAGGGGNVVCGGDWSSGALGFGDWQPSTPTNFVEVDQSVMGAVAALAHSGSASATCAITPSGDVWCWGRGTNGSLGDGQFQNSNIPVQVSGLNMGPQ
jgi:alpha-tubulin suppressor-like RCC1 family protein/carbonic anhydrase/acetyltransferase-like protein (isoleucine patch superfamily)